MRKYSCEIGTTVLHCKLVGDVIQLSEKLYIAKSISATLGTVKVLVNIVGEIMFAINEIHSQAATDS